VSGTSARALDFSTPVEAKSPPGKACIRKVRQLIKQLTTVANVAGSQNSVNEGGERTDSDGN